MDSNETMVIRGEFGTLFCYYIEMSFKHCKNETNHNIVCKSEEKIEKRLSDGYFGMYISDNGVEPGTLKIQ
jgi:hypothetical protein